MQTVTNLTKINNNVVTQLLVLYTYNELLYVNELNLKVLPAALKQVTSIVSLTKTLTISTKYHF